MTLTQTDTHTQFAGRRVTVMGLGRFGGGAGVTRWLISQGANVTLTDVCTETQLADSLRSIDDLIDTGNLHLRLGGHDPRDFQSADLVIANPAVPRPWDNELLSAARSAGVPITTEIQLLVQRLDRRRVIGVTGTAGKSTTATMIHHVLSRLGRRAHLGGNIGGSLLNQLNRIAQGDWIVLELSSAMLHWLGDWSPATAVITNIAPNHLDWHGSFEHYQQSKQNITRCQQPGECCIHDDQLPDDDSLNINLRIPGRHNIVNARIAIETLRQALGIDPNAAALALDDFTGLPHRLQLVTESNGLCFYNDSKATTPEATVRAVESFPDPSRIHLIAGGYDKGADLSRIASLAPQLAGLYCIGATAPAIVNSAPAFARAVAAHTLDAAVPTAIGRMTPGDLLLLSPGCASWDQFENFEQRGMAFIELVHQQLNRRAAHAGPF